MTAKGLQTYIYVWQSTNEPDSRRVIERLWPYLGEAKREQAQDALAASTWHDGNRNQFLCKDPTHERRVMSGRNRCYTCVRAYHRAYGMERRRRLAAEGGREYKRRGPYKRRQENSA